MAICVSHDNINNNKNITNINVAPAAVETLVATSESIRNLSATMVDVEGNSERIANSLGKLRNVKEKESFVGKIHGAS